MKIFKIQVFGNSDDRIRRHALKRNFGINPFAVCSDIFWGEES